MVWRHHRVVICGFVLAVSIGLLAAASAGDEVRVVDPDLVKQVNQSIERGLAFLAAQQQADGGWKGSWGSDPAITALVAQCFAQHPDYGVDHPIVKRAFDFILKYVQPDGGIYLPHQGLKNYYTSIAVMALNTSKDDRIRQVVAKANTFLTELQWDEGESVDRKNEYYGGAGYGHGRRPDLSNTQMMLEALHQSGLPPEHPVFKKAMIFVSRCQMRSESNDQSFASGGGDGGFIYSPAHGGQSKAGKEEVNGQRRLRSYGSMTYSGFKSMLYAGLDHNDPRVRAAYDWIRNHYTLDRNPNMPDKQSKEGLYYFYHVFARALDAWGEDRIVDGIGGSHPWRRELCLKLRSLQRSDGSWFNDEDRWWESNPQLVTAYSILAMQTCFQ